jgi:hypothetical protein
MKIRIWTYSEQLAHLKSMYKDCKSSMDNSGFVWTCSIKPTELSQTYTIKITYHLNQFPKCYVVNPKPLALAEGATRLPHTYNSKRQQLCLFYPSLNEWNSTMSISKTIVHWAVQWLFYYEIWLYTGVWNGGGHGNWDADFKDKYQSIYINQ